MPKTPKWYQNSSGICVLKNLNGAKKMGSRGPLDFTGIALSYERVYGKKATWNDLVREIEPYSLEQIVIVICRIRGQLGRP